jgi:hypothetical protein
MGLRGLFFGELYPYYAKCAQTSVVSLAFPGGLFENFELRKTRVIGDHSITVARLTMEGLGRHLLISYLHAATA